MKKTFKLIYVNTIQSTDEINKLYNEGWQMHSSEAERVSASDRDSSKSGGVYYTLYKETKI